MRLPPSWRPFAVSRSRHHHRHPIFLSGSGSLMVSHRQRAVKEFSPTDRVRVLLPAVKSANVILCLFGLACVVQQSQAILMELWLVISATLRTLFAYDLCFAFYIVLDCVALLSFAFLCSSFLLVVRVLAVWRLFTAVSGIASVKNERSRLCPGTCFSKK